MGRIIPESISRREVIRYLRDIEHKVIDILETESEQQGKPKGLNKNGISNLFDNICKDIYYM